jgi:YegS/Rv2252/BmrU family lipid kinase
MVVLNPYAGRGAAGRARPQLEAALRQAGVRFELVETRAAGEAMALAAAAHMDGYEVVAAAGGDGTVNEVLNGLAEATATDQPIAKLALLPVGTGNDLATMLGLPGELSAAAAVIAAGRTRRIDVGCATLVSPAGTVVRYFDNNMGLGFEAQVTLESYGIHRLAGTLRYVVAALRALRSFPIHSVKVSWERPDGVWEERSQPTLLISVGNSARTGGVFYMTPDAQLDDGLLDVGVVKEIARWRILALMPKVLRGAHRNEPAIELSRCRQLRMHCVQGLPVHLDGEVVLRDVQQAEVVVQPGRLEVVA